MVPGTTGDWDEKFIVPGSVIYYNNTYHMWYSGGSPLDVMNIGHAYSQDGISWTKDTNNPVLTVGQPGDWDDDYIQCGGVLVIDSMFHMWYTGHAGAIINKNFRIGHATSPDGIIWTKDANNPVLEEGPEGSWDDTWVADGNVLYDGNGYNIWYTGWGGGFENVRFGHATSPDGVNWTKDNNNPVLSYEPGKWDYTRVDMPNVVFDGATYHMWYSGGDFFSWQIGYATSTDGSTWTKYANNPVLLKGSVGDWDDLSIAWCSVIDSANVKYKMWYSGTQFIDNGSIGYAESENLNAITNTKAGFLSIFPNPVNDLLTIETDIPGTYLVEITSINGQLLYSSKMEGISLQVDLNSFKKGAYFITIRSEDFVTTRKIIKL